MVVVHIIGAMESSVVLDPAGFHCTDKNSSS